MITPMLVLHSKAFAEKKLDKSKQRLLMVQKHESLPYDQLTDEGSELSYEDGDSIHLSPRA